MEIGGGIIKDRLVVVGIADLKVTADPEDILITYALGSCIAVCVYDPKVRVGGMIHFMLPVSQKYEKKALENPAMFGDTGIPLLFHEMYDHGARKEDLVVKVVGGGRMQDKRGLFKIGKKNFMIVRKILWKNGIMIAAEDVGEMVPKTVRMHVKDGKVIVTSRGKDQEI